MAKKLFFVALLVVLAIVSSVVNVSADPHDLVEGMMEGSAHLAKGAVDTALAGGHMMEGMVDRGLHPFGRPGDKQQSAEGQSAEGPGSGSSSSSSSSSSSGSASGGSSGGMGGGFSGGFSGNMGGSGSSGGGIGPGLLRR